MNEAHRALRDPAPQPARSGGAPTPEPAPGWWAGLAGAPLDAVKAAAAGLMVCDHVNTVLLNGAAPALWRLGRAAYPLFALVLALQVLRGAEPGRALTTLLVAGVLAQAPYALAFDYGSREANILFTLAAGLALAVALLRAGETVRHLLLAAVVAGVLLAPHYTRGGVDFGLAGIALPAALALGVARPRRFGPWALAVLFALNWGNWKPPGETMALGAGLDLAAALLGGALVVGLARTLAGRPRFLGRYALHAFYPLHLLVLAGMRAWLG